MARIARLTLQACLALFSASCHDAPTAAYIAPPVCPRTVDVTVGTGLEPDISWAPACGISSVVVTTMPSSLTDPGTMMWFAYVNEASPFAPAIHYGHAPAGASTQSPLALIAGTSYQVWVYQTVGQDAISAQGVKEFTP
jgi:hypothetical protein